MDTDTDRITDNRSAQNQNDEALGPAAKVRTTTLKPIEGGSKDAQKVKPKGETEAQRVVKAAAEKEATAQQPSAVREPPKSDAKPSPPPWGGNAATAARTEAQDAPAQVEADPLKGLALVPEAWCATCGAALYDGRDGYLCRDGHKARMLSDALQGAEGWEAAARKLRPHHGPKAAARLMGALEADVEAFWAEEDRKVAAQVAAQTPEPETRGEPPQLPEAGVDSGVDSRLHCVRDTVTGAKYAPAADGSAGVEQWPRRSTSYSFPPDVALGLKGTFTVDWAREYLPPQMLVCPYDTGVPGAIYSVEGAVEHLEPHTLLIDPSQPKTDGPAGVVERDLRAFEGQVEDALAELAHRQAAAEQRQALLAKALCRVLLDDEAPRLSFEELSRLMDLAAQAK